ncbi:MAG: glycosyltransferase family 2 protein [Planctomycetota bacterium]|jgi:GT2 family glycosyltransferase
MPEPIVSIIVPTYRRPEHLGRCLESIATTVDLPHEVIGVSVAGDDETAAVIEQRDARHIVQPDRGGMVQATNLGLRAAAGSFVIQLNDDCTLLPHSIANAVRFLEAPAHADVGQAAFFHDSPVRRNVQQQICVEGTWYFVCHVRGLCYANFGLVRRSLGERLGWLDERYFMYGADPDFSLKVWHEAKLAVVPCPGALIHHLELDDDRAAAERGQQQTDNERLFEKWGMTGETVRLAEETE